MVLMLWEGREGNLLDFCINILCIGGNPWHLKTTCMVILLLLPTRREIKGKSRMNLTSWWRYSERSNPPIIMERG